MKMLKLFNFVLFGLSLNAHTTTDNGRCDEVTNTCAVISCSTHSSTGIPGRDGRDGKEGPIGEKGERGLQGSRGNQGPPGKLGPPGVKGDKGSIGQKGEQGISATSEVDTVREQLKVFETELKELQASLTKYNKSLHGGPGTPGERGSAGPPGKIGPKGNQGDNGIAGPTGSKGDKGSTGATGVGTPGLKGDKGEKGNQDDAVKEQLKAFERQLQTLQASLNKYNKILLFHAVKQSGNKLFATNDLKESFENAQKTCRESGGNVATPKNAAENSAVQQILQTMGDSGTAFLGISDLQVEGTFKYFSGDKITYTNWNIGEPNNNKYIEDCVEIRENGKWNDISCNLQRSVICEFL
ncbi:uncharacterized protein LOC142161440 isoform X2 [Mixophyes fleayi]|uniref:uncharacterized protein LOC142161440 isoform X2 n=1 Tax=Mixophyes fleayi TaxID=3061075 RepID=UPI003F4DBB2F